MWRALCFGACAFVAGHAQLGDTANEKGQAMNMKIPQLSEEETSSKTVPDEFKCDACKAAIYQLALALDRVKIRDSKELLEAGGKKAVQAQAAKISEALEAACEQETYEDYGIKSLTVDEGQTGQKRLDGPGLDVEGAGTTQGGGNWPMRLRAVCEHILGEEEDLGLVKHWTAGSLPSLCDLDCGRRKKEPRKARKRKDTTAKPSTSPKKGKPTLTGLEELPPPPHFSQQVDVKNMSEFTKLNKKNKFALVLFFDNTPRCALPVAILELAARKLEKAREADLRKMKNAIARYNSTDGDTYGYNMAINTLPKMLFWRKGYKNPKAYDGEMNGPDQIVDWLRHEILDVYMKDDPKAYPRLSEKTDL